MRLLGHLKTITHHKLLVMGYCFRVGLFRQGLLHDMSKYAPSEFWIGAKYYSGIRSPNAAEREALGYSTAWLHHKGRNKHHLEYWIDYGGRDMKLTGHPMPTKYMVELCLDRIAACRVYHGAAYTDRDPLEYLEKSKDSHMMHPETRAQVVEILSMLAQRGEKETLRYLRRVVLKHPAKRISNLPPAPGDPAKKDPTFLPAEKLQHLATTIPTPFYLYDQSGIEMTCKAIRQAFSWNPGYRQFFPIKATPTAAILQLLRANGQGVVCSSASELTLCQRCGFSPEEILFLPNYPKEEDLQRAAEVGCMPILDSPELVRPFYEKGLLHGPVGLRITPEGIFRFGLIEVKTEGIKFGMSPAQAADVAAELKTLGVTELGLMAYLAGNTLSPDYAVKVAVLLCDTAMALQNILPVSYIDISGGLGLAYRPEEEALSLPAVSKSIEAVFQQKFTGTALAGMRLYTEFGRFVTGPHGILATTVTQIKHGRRSFAGVDASAADLMRPMLYGAYHHISVAGQEGAQPRTPWDIVGSVCENTDKFAENRNLPALHIGDLLVIHDAGAHGHAMGYNYGGRLRCGEYLWDGTSAREIRRPETTEDYLSTQIFNAPIRTGSARHLP